MIINKRYINKSYYCINNCECIHKIKIFIALFGGVPMHGETSNKAFFIMGTRICKKCNEKKENKYFYHGKDGYIRNTCKACTYKRDQENRKQNSEKWKNYYIKWGKDNKSKINEIRRRHYKKNSKRIADYSKKYQKSHPEKFKTAKAIRDKLYSQKNKEKIKQYKNKYRKNNIEKIRKKHQIYKSNKRKSNSLYKMTENLRKRTWEAFKKKSYKKGGTTEKLLGISYDIVKQHIENLFEYWMSWDNYGEWEIDHIIPLASAKTEDELKRLCHYANLQPLLKSHNLAKGCKLNYSIPT